MSLNLMLINRHGVWQSSDLRLASSNNGRLVDDYSVKQVTLKCPDGVAVIAYTGIGSVHGVHISDWIRMILRGESRTVNESLIFLRESATTDLGPHVARNQIPHTFTIGTFVRGRPWAVQIRNYEPVPFRGTGVKLLVRQTRGHVVARSIGLPKREFHTVAQEIGSTAGQHFVIGPANAVSRADMRLLARLLRSEPRTGMQVCELLARINQRASQSRFGVKTISPHCVTTFVSAADGKSEAKFHSANAAPVPIVMPYLQFGIDLTDVLRGLAASMNPRAGVEQMPVDGFASSVTPRNPLRKP